MDKRKFTKQQLLSQGDKANSRGVDDKFYVKCIYDDKGEELVLGGDVVPIYVSDNPEALLKRLQEEGDVSSLFLKEVYLGFSDNSMTTLLLDKDKKYPYSTVLQEVQDGISTNLDTFEALLKKLPNADLRVHGQRVLVDFARAFLRLETFSESVNESSSWFFGANAKV